jgi:DNA-binding response OmpR family regulator
LNLKTKNKEHLTEKENELLFYFCTHKNVEIKRNEILNTIWGFSDSINTHTLETHIYRLKLKIDKLEPDLSFSLSNQKGFYTMKFNKII